MAYGEYKAQLSTALEVCASVKTCSGFLGFLRVPCGFLADPSGSLGFLSGILAVCFGEPEQVTRKDLESMDVLLARQNKHKFYRSCSNVRKKPGRNLEGNGPAKPPQESRKKSARKPPRNNKKYA